MKKEESSVRKLSSKKGKATEKVSMLRSKLAEIQFSENEFDSLENEKISLENSVSSLKETVQTLKSQLNGRLAFSYSDPVRGFDRSKVKGLVARLISVKQSEYATALEVVAGGKLYNVIVDEAITAKALLDRGRLKRRVTIVPLDKISSRKVPDEKVKLASSIAAKLDTTSSTAIDLVGFDEEIRNAIEYVFGSSLIVDGMDAANKICDVTKTRTVTIEGDVYDPSGTISGGSNKTLCTLGKLTELLTATKELNDSEDRLKVVTTKLINMKQVSETFFQLKDALEIASTELHSIEKHLSQTSFGMLSGKYNAMIEEIAEAEQNMNSLEEEKEKNWALYNELKAKETDLTLEREKKLKGFDDILRKAKLDAVKAVKRFREVIKKFTMCAFYLT